MNDGTRGDSRQERLISFVPPVPAVFDELARLTCKTLSEREQQTIFAEDETIEGLSKFLKAVAHMTAKSLSTEKSV